MITSFPARPQITQTVCLLFDVLRSSAAISTTYLSISSTLSINKLNIQAKPLMLLITRNAVQLS